MASRATPRRTWSNETRGRRCADRAQPRRLLESGTEGDPADERTQNATDDERLVARVRAAVEARVPANGLAAFVGQGPLIDTTAGGSLLALQGVDFAPDPDHPDERIDRNKVRAVVYWRRPVPGDDPHVVGIQVGDANVARVFFAIILSPD